MRINIRRFEEGDDRDLIDLEIYDDDTNTGVDIIVSKQKPQSFMNVNVSATLDGRETVPIADWNHLAKRSRR